MAISFPRTDVFTAGNFVTQSFKLVSRQELSRSSNGVNYGKDLGSALWAASWETRYEYHDTAIDFEAIINSLGGVSRTFYGGDLRRQYPLLDPKGITLSANVVKIHTVSSGTSWRLKGLPAGYKISRGDYFSYNYGSPSSRALVQAAESVTADGSGITAEFMVLPELRAGTAADAVVTMKNPTAEFMLVPDGFEPSMVDITGSIATITAIQRL